MTPDIAASEAQAATGGGLDASTTAPKHVRRKLARPSELLDAALQLFVEKGYAAATVEEVARRAGVSKGTLFLYFASKEALFKAVVRRHIGGVLAEWDAGLVHFTGSTADMLRHCLFEWWRRIGSTPAAGISKLMICEARHFPELARFYRAEVVQPGTALIARILRRGVAHGEFRPVDERQAVHLVMAPMIFLVLWRQSLGACCADDAPDAVIDPEAYLNAQLDLLLHALCATPAARTGAHP